MAPSAVVVGAGHNALTCAAYLARAGVRVVLCERRGVVGGAAVTEEFAPGFRVSTASYALSLLRPDVYADLELARHGLEISAKDPQMFVPLPDGRHFFVWRDADRTRDEIASISPSDADAYPRWCAFWDETVAKLRPLVDDPDPPSPADVLDADSYRLAVAGSAAGCVETFFDHPGVQGAFASQGVIGTWASVRDPGTAWVMSFHAIGGEIYGGSGTWGYVRGGMGAVSTALHAAAREAGAEVRVNAPVDEILVDGGRTSGVRLADGTFVRGDLVLSGADPKTTFLDLVPSGSLDDAFVTLVREWSSPGCVLKVNFALRELPDFSAVSGTGPQHRGTVEIAPSIDYLHEAFEDAKDGRPSRRPFMELFCGSAVDPSLVDGDGHVVSAFTQYVPPDCDEEMRDAAVRNVIETIATYAPNFPGAIVSYDALGPRELEERFGLSGGNIFHGEITPEQSFGARFDYRTPIAGLYLCGSGARPGGGVMGAPGRNAARAVLDDLKRG